MLSHSCHASALDHLCRRAQLPAASQLPLPGRCASAAGLQPGLAAPTPPSNRQQTQRGSSVLFLGGVSHPCLRRVPHLSLTFSALCSKLRGADEDKGPVGTAQADECWAGLWLPALLRALPPRAPRWSRRLQTSTARHAGPRGQQHREAVALPALRATPMAWPTAHRHAASVLGAQCFHQLLPCPASQPRVSGRAGQPPSNPTSTGTDHRPTKRTGGRVCCRQTVC